MSAKIFAVNDAEATTAAAAIAFSATANDSDAFAAPLTVVSINATGTKGLAAIDPTTGLITYSPNGAFNYLNVGQTAVDSFQYTVSDGHGDTSIATVTVVITGVEVPPVAVAETYSISASQYSMTLTPTVYDTDFNRGNRLTLTSVDTTGTRGTVSLIGAFGLVVYSPGSAFAYLSAGESASDSFRYTISDGHGGTAVGVITLTVNGVNVPPVAHPITATTGAYCALGVNAIAYATDINRDDVLTITALNLAGTRGTASIDPVTGAIDYAPNGAFAYLSAGETATDTLRYTVSDNHGASSTSTLTVTVTGVNVAPVAVAETAATTAYQSIVLSPAAFDTDVNRDDRLSIIAVNGTGASGQVLLGSGGTVTYNPNGAFDYLSAGESATDTFHYTVTDNHGATSVGAITVTVAGVNVAPVAGDAAVSVPSDQPVWINALANDTDVNADDTLSITSLNLAGTQGQVAIEPNGQLLYTPTGADASLPVGASATDSFGYTVSDGHGGTASATVTVTINGVSPAFPDLLGSGYLSTQGSQYVDGAGQVVRIVAVGWAGTDNRDFAPRDLIGVNYQATMRQMVENGFNTIRIPWTDALLTASPAPGAINYALNPDLQGLSSIQVLQKIVAYAGQIGLKIIFDHHSDEGYGGQQRNGLWYDLGGASNGTDGGGHTGTVSQQTFLNDSVNFAQLWAGNDTVIGFDLDNEPVKSTWAGPATTSIQTMSTTVGDAIQAVDPGALIIVEGPPTTGAPDGNLASAGADPVVLTDANKVVYSVHEYPPSVNPGIFNGNPAQYIQQLNADWGYLVTGNIAPVWIGEMGSSLKTAADQLWAQTLLIYMNGGYAAEGGPAVATGQQGVSGDWWDWWDQPSGQVTGLLGANYSGVKPDQYAIVQQMYPQLPAAVAASAQDTLILQLSDTAANGGALFTVSLDGVQIGGTQTVTALSTASAVQTFTFAAALGPGAHSLDIHQVGTGGSGALAGGNTILATTVDLDGTLQSLVPTNAAGGADLDYAIAGPSIINAGTVDLGNDTASVVLTQPGQMVFLAAGTHAIDNTAGSFSLQVTGGSATLSGFNPTVDQIDLAGGIGGYASAAQAAAAVVTDGAGGAFLPLGSGSLDFAGVLPVSFSPATFLIR